MDRVTVIGYSPVMDEVVTSLQRAGVLEVTTAEDLERVAIDPEDTRLRRLDEQVADAHFVRDFLGRFHVPTQPFSTFVAEKFHLSYNDYLELTFDSHARRLYRECVTLADRIAAGERERERLECLIVDLTPWREFRLEIKDWRHTESATLFTGTVPAASGAEIRQRLRDEVSEVTVEELGPVGDRQAWAVMAHRAVAAEVRGLLASTEFAEVTFPDLSNYPAEEIAQAEARIEAIEVEHAEHADRAADLAKQHYHGAVCLVEALESDRDALLVRGGFGRTQRTFVVTGWARADHRDAIEEGLTAFSGDVDVTFEAATSKDDPPVELDNPWYLKPFEIVTDLYGRPAYGELDPTPLIAPFFLLFFSICIGDVGYGAMLIAGALAIKHKLDVAPGVKRFMDLLVFGGAGSMVVGVLVGSYFALPVDSLPPVLRSLQVIDPLTQLIPFLLISLVIGLVQVFFGVFLAAYNAIRRGDAEEAVFGQLSIVLIFLAIAAAVFAGTAGNGELVRFFLVTGIVGAMVMQGRAVQSALRGEDAPAWDRALGWVWAIGFVAAIAGYAVTGVLSFVWIGLGLSALSLFSRAVRRGVIGVLLGAYEVYGLTGFVGDILSYLRLAALGLSSTLVGGVFNVLTGLVWTAAAPLFSSGPVAFVFGVIVAVLAVAVFAFGHTFNVVINLLGAFVHPARLQFVEFFSKFYEAGGRPLSPFRFRTQNLVLDASGASKEGGSTS